jgi:hypothetical protein
VHARLGLGQRRPLPFLTRKSHGFLSNLSRVMREAFGKSGCAHRRLLPYNGLTAIQAHKTDTSPPTAQRLRTKSVSIPVSSATLPLDGETGGLVGIRPMDEGA